jgi:hypothetical protein
VGVRGWSAARRCADGYRLWRDYQDLKQELGHFEGRGWRGFHHHATLCIAAYGFLISERETIPPSGLGRARSLSPPALSDNYQPRDSAAACRTAHPKLDCNDASTADRRHRLQIAAMPMLRSSNGQASAEKPYDAVRLTRCGDTMPTSAIRREAGPSRARWSPRSNGTLESFIPASDSLSPT